MIALRALMVLVVLAIVAVAAVPLLVLVDLADGGDGWGLCPGGLGVCRSSYFDGPELAATLTLTLFVLVALSRVLFLLNRAITRRRRTALVH